MKKNYLNLLQNVEMRFVFYTIMKNNEKRYKINEL